MLVLVPGLEWAHAPTVLGRLARTSLSVRAAPARSGAVDGYLTVNKGARSGAPAGVGAGRVVALGSGLRLVDWMRLRRHDAGLRVAGVVLTPWPDAPSRMEESNRRTIAELGAVAVATLRTLRDAAPSTLAAAGARLPLETWL